MEATNISEIEFSNLMGHYLQNIDGTFTRNTKPDKFDYWKLCLEREGITSVRIVKQNKNSHFKVIIK